MMWVHVSPRLTALGHSREADKPAAHVYISLSSNRESINQDNSILPILTYRFYQGLINTDPETDVKVV